MRYSKIEILNALHVIKTLCSEHEDNECYQCPLGRHDGKCVIQAEIPETWKIEDGVYERFKAFL